MKHNIAVAICCILTLFSFSGCQLAKEELGAGSLEDRLVGAYVTTGHTGLFGLEGRLEAVLKTREAINEETGDTEKIEEYVFEDANGIPYLIPTIAALPGRNSYFAAMSSDIINEKNTDLRYSDDTISVALVGTIYAVPSNTELIFHVNSVYQREDGSIYAVPNAGVSASGMEAEGAAMYQTLDASYTVVENGRTRTDSVSITVSIKIMFAPEKIVILQMGKGSEAISRIECEPGAVPDALALDTGTAYLIVETHKRDTAGNLAIAREVYGRDAETIETFSVRQDGILLKHMTQITTTR